jgi:outer membrane protein OmpA-like peptidoglycan-associated protein
MPLAGIVSALVLVGAGGYVLGSGGDADSVETATETTADEAPSETTVEPSTTRATDQAEDAAPTTPTTAAPEPTTTAPTTTAPPTTAPSTTAAVDETDPADGQQVVVADGEVRGAVLRGGVLYLGGAVPSREVADTIIGRAAAIIGEDNIVDEYVIDPTAAVPLGAPLYVDDVVLFAYGSPTFDAQFTPLLDLGLALLVQNPQVTVTVITHTDASGTASYNQELSYRRGESVAQYWIDRGVPSEQIVIDARGERDPVADNNSAAGAQLNRRAEFYIEGLLG